MFKNLFRLLIFISITIILLISYLSIFGIKTNKFNDLIKSQIIKQDDRLNVDLKDVFIKLNIREKSISLNSKDLKFYIQQQSQKITNINVLVGLDSFIKKNHKIKKIIINSDENEINKLLKFIRVYKINIPILYLENSITKGIIIYNVTIDFTRNVNDRIKIAGEIKDSELNFLKKEQFKNINLIFSFKNQNLEIKNLNFRHKNISFNSSNISGSLKNDTIKIKGDIENKINSKFISSIIDYNVFQI